MQTLEYSTNSILQQMKQNSHIPVITICYIKIVKIVILTFNRSEFANFRFVPVGVPGFVPEAGHEQKGLRTRDRLSHPHPKDAVLRDLLISVDTWRK